MKNTIQRLTQYEQLSKEEAREIIYKIAEGKFNPTSLTVILAVFMMRKIKVQELEGFRDALLELSIKIDLSDYNTIDLCGTGGDGKNTFNISTLASFVVAGAGFHVAKHGNYGVSSLSGSSDVLERIGVNFTNDQDFLKTCLDEAGICFLHAPLFHPVMKNVAGIRRDLGVKTFFNMLGPMINPSAPKNQMIGVFDLELMRMYAYIHQKENQNFSIVHSLSGHDEISLIGPTKIITNEEEFIIEAENLNVKSVTDQELFGGNSIDEAVQIFMQIINGQGTEAQNNVVCANAGLAISMMDKSSLQDGFEKAKESLRSGKAKQALENILKISQ